MKPPEDLDYDNQDLSPPWGEINLFDDEAFLRSARKRCAHSSADDVIPGLCAACGHNVFWRNWFVTNCMRCHPLVSTHKTTTGPIEILTVVSNPTKGLRWDKAPAAIPNIRYHTPQTPGKPKRAAKRRQKDGKPPT